tara:strand:- start:464 stop:826 length:363 start_codon:yes stop_codon:yes gene_type:complete
MKNPEAYLRRKSGILFFVLILLTSTSCDEFSRFTEEKYVCSTKYFGPVTITIKDPNVGKNVEVEGPAFYRRFKIKEINDNYINLSDGKSVVSINRKRKSIGFKHNNRFEEKTCKRHYFKM